MSSNIPYINPTTRQLPKHQNPLAKYGVAPGYYFDETTGLVRPIATSRKPK